MGGSAAGGTGTALDEVIPSAFAAAGLAARCASEAPCEGGLATGGAEGGGAGLRQPTAKMPPKRASENTVRIGRGN